MISEVDENMSGSIDFAEFLKVRFVLVFLHCSPFCVSAPLAGAERSPPPPTPTAANFIDTAAHTGD